MAGYDIAACIRQTGLLLCIVDLRLIFLYKEPLFFITSQAREEFIGKKYVQRMYRHVSPLFGDPVALGEVKITHF